ncbi:unnamed protein product, partial [Ectocarpus sp. 6 AP-2014]
MRMLPAKGCRCCCLPICSVPVSTQYLLTWVQVQLTSGRLPLPEAKSSGACEKVLGTTIFALCAVSTVLGRTCAYLFFELSRGVVRVKNGGIAINKACRHCGRVMGVGGLHGKTDGGCFGARCVAVLVLVGEGAASQRRGQRIDTRRGVNPSYFFRFFFHLQRVRRASPVKEKRDGKSHRPTALYRPLDGEGMGMFFPKQPTLGALATPRSKRHSLCFHKTM